jgi:flagellar motor switch protein FliM
MADGKLSQAEIDALLASMRPQTVASEPTRNYVEFDFRRPSKFTRELIRSIEASHELFARRFAGLVTQQLRAIVHVEPLATDQITYQDYIRSMANPTVLTILNLTPWKGQAVVELSTQMALTLVDRMLGGPGRPIPLRRPTDLEITLVRILMDAACSALKETFADVAEIAPTVSSVELNPNFVQAVAPSEMALLLSYQVSMTSARRTDGLLTLCYPFSTLQPAVERLERQVWTEDRPSLASADLEGEQPLNDHLPDVDVPITVRLRVSEVPAIDLATLRPGDVLRLDHRVGEPAIGTIEGREVLEGNLGRIGRRLALQLTEWLVDE